MTLNHKIILKTISIALIVEGIAMLFPCFAGILFGEKDCAFALFFTGGLAILSGIFFCRRYHFDRLSLKTREDLYITITTWLAVCLVGALPFLFSGQGFTLAEAIFESTAGWTTTGAWVTDPAAMAKSLLLWKAISSWLGAMGILLLTISLFPLLGIHGQKMAKSEIPGPSLQKIYAKMSDNAKLSYKIYIALTVLEFLLLLPAKLPVFSLLINTLFSISTAGVVNFSGFAPLSLSPYVQTVLTIFTFLSSCNFMLFFFLSVGKWKKVFRNTELRVYTGLLSASALLIAFLLVFSGEYASIPHALGDALTQAISCASTSGFKIADTGAWPAVCQMVLLLLLFIGGCSASTSGSLKVIRFVLFVKLILRGGYKRIHPHAIKPVMLEGEAVSAKNASATTGFILLFFVIFIFSSIVFSLENLDMESTLSVALGLFTNTGTAFGVTAYGDYSMLSAFSKLYASLLMLCGRLEILPVIMLFSRSFWNADRARA